MVVCWKTMEQYTTVNCMNAYSKELTKVSTDQHSAYAKSYTKCICQFERLHQMYMCAKNKKDVLITKKH